MPGLFSHLSFRSLAKAVAGVRRGIGAFWLDPFETLHRINWSAPWLERKF